jgi:hypothetical protein
MPNSKNEKLEAGQRIIDEAFKCLERARAEKPKDPFDGKHLSVVTLSMWADDEFPESFLEEYIARFGNHLFQCEKCQKNVAFYRTQRRSKNPF